VLQIKNLYAKLIEEQTPILNGVNLTVLPGKIHLLRGKNGSGKSTLAQVISGHPKFEITQGEIVFMGESINDLAANDRSKLGIFHANQYPIEIPGVNLTNFLRMAYNAKQEKPLSPIKFRKLLNERAKLINFPPALLERNLNEGFSGGEKKKTEVLQMAVLEPKLAILDETDSGLDPQAIEEVFNGIAAMRKELLPDLALLIITHYDRVERILTPDFEYVMSAGQIE
jgi:Fe-S cluster assembly ATP-binding protein